MRGGWQEIPVGVICVDALGVAADSADEMKTVIEPESDAGPNGDGLLL